MKKMFYNLYYHNVNRLKISRMLNAFTCLEYKNINYDLSKKNVEFINRVYELFEEMFGRF